MPVFFLCFPKSLSCLFSACPLFVYHLQSFPLHFVSRFWILHAIVNACVNKIKDDNVLEVSFINHKHTAQEVTQDFHQTPLSKGHYMDSADKLEFISLYIYIVNPQVKTVCELISNYRTRFLSVADLCCRCAPNELIKALMTTALWKYGYIVEVEESFIIKLDVFVKSSLARGIVLIRFTVDAKCWIVYCESFNEQSICPSVSVDTSAVHLYQNILH